MNFKNIKSIRLVIITISFILFTGCGNNKIEGKVQDVFGNPLSDVIVTIDKTTFKTKTNGSGEYSIDYVPGKIEMLFSRDGYTTRTLSLNIQKKEHFPAETIELFPIPERKGIYYVNLENKKLVNINKDGYVKCKKNFMGGVCYINTPLILPKIKVGDVMFIDNAPEQLILVAPNNKGVIAKYSGLSGILYNGEIQENILEMPDRDDVVVRETKLKPGRYAFIEVNEQGAKENGAIYPFVVVDKSFNKPKAINKIKATKEVIKKYVINVVKNGSFGHKYKFGNMPPNLVTGKDIEAVAIYVANKLKGEKPPAWRTCAGCHGDDGKGENGAAPSLIALPIFNKIKQ